ncbi:MAG: class I SAM-dependent methyltransferase [Geopsychrobacter sp.]|nr:class I SAM-dependent methyltransferase [Geopsychrobacter sp.]
MSSALSNIVAWSQRLLCEVLTRGDFAIDLTAGNGYDTLMLAQAVGTQGKVLAIDLQLPALKNTARRLAEQGVQVHSVVNPDSSLVCGVSLIQANHADLKKWQVPSPRAIIANLGYLPGGAKELVTRSETTVAALKTGCELLACGGRIAVVVYPGHPGGRCEAAAVEGFFDALDVSRFEVLRIQVTNRQQAPFLLIASKLV